jgi:hypothetical protein
VYQIALGPITYVKRGGVPFTLPEAMRELHGCGQARIVRLDGTVAVRLRGAARPYGPRGASPAGPPVGLFSSARNGPHASRGGRSACPGTVGRGDQPRRCVGR